VRQSVLYECLVSVMSGQPQESARAPAASAPAQSGQRTMRGSILLVEDNLINQQVALGILQIQGYNVTVVNNGKEALDAHAAADFDLILMDCHMPEVDGFEATREIRGRERASGKHVPIVALTANAMAHDREDCLNAGMDDHLSKPFSMQTLQAMLDRWMPQAAPGASQESVDAVDGQVLHRLRKVMTNGRPELLAKVINLYLSESPKLLQRLRRAAVANDGAELARVAHSLKSSSANVGAKALSRYCENMESSARRGEVAAARTLLAQIEYEHGCVQSALALQSEQLAA
jgi:CheY-like chemotaxis protein